MTTIKTVIAKEIEISIPEIVEALQYSPVQERYAMVVKLLTSITDEELEQMGRLQRGRVSAFLISTARRVDPEQVNKGVGFREKKYQLDS